MFVHFQVPMKSKSWPLIIVHGSGYTGSCVEGTAAGSEGWMDYTVRMHPDLRRRSGRARRSGFDKSVIHEGEHLIGTDPAAAVALLPTFGGSTSTAWTSCSVASFRQLQTLPMARWSDWRAGTSSQMVCPRPV